MFAQINHMAMISPNFALLERYYRSMFRLDFSTERDAESSCIVTDGYVGLNILPRRDGYIGGIDHFGLKVDSIDEVLNRMKSAHPKANIVKRPSTRPFAAYSGHDPDGNVFDLSEKRGTNLKDVHAKPPESNEQRDCTFDRFAIRTMNPEVCAEFYAKVFDLKPANTEKSVTGYHLSDGKITLSLLPWSIDIYAGMSIRRPGPDHIGIRVRNLAEFKKEEKRIGEKNTFIASRPLGGSKESNVRRKLIESSILGDYATADPDGNWLDIREQA